MADIQEKFTMVKDLSKIYYLRRLRDLLHIFSTYHIESIPVPSVYSLARDGYKAIVCSELNMDTGDYYWKSALLFRIVRERRAIWHTIVQVDYIVLDPSRKRSFSSMSDSLRLLTQFVERQSKASRLDLMVRLDTQLNSTIYLHAARKLKLEGMHDIGDGFVYMKRLRDIDPRTGANKVIAPLPTPRANNTEGMHPLVQSAIMPRKRRNGGLISFIGGVRRYGTEYNAIYEFCRRNSLWEHPKLDDRVSYMQSVFPSSVTGSVKDYVDSLCNDAQFIKLTNPKGHIVAMMAMVAGYSTPATTPKDSDWVSPDRVVFIPLVMCQSGTTRRWTKVGFMQAQELYKEMFRILTSQTNSAKYDMIACLVQEGSIHAGLLRTVGFKRTAVFRSQNSDDSTTLSYYSIMI